MVFSPVAWAYRDVATSTKLAQMVENLRVHDHRSTDQGANLGARELASGVATGVAPSLASGGNTVATVNLPAGRFANAPRVFATIVGTHVQGRRLTARAVTTTTFELAVANGSTAVPAGGLTVSWIAVDAP